MMSWDVRFTSRAEKQARNLLRDVQEIMFALVLEITKLGPARTFWPNYRKIKGKKDCYHCHLKKGKPTYVAIWKIIDKKNKFVEVRYVGTHEKADYGQFC